MNKRIDFTQLEGLGFTQDTLDFLQQSYRDAFGALAVLIGDLVIVHGAADLGTTYGPGWVSIGGELMPFLGGTKAANIIVEEVASNELFEDGNSKPVYYVKSAKLASVGGNAFNTFTRLSTIKQIITDYASKVAKAGDTMTGPLTIPNGTLSGHAINLSQLQALKNELLGGASAAFDTLGEIQAALANDASLAATLNAQIALKAAIAQPAAVSPIPTADWEGSIFTVRKDTLGYVHFEGFITSEIYGTSLVTTLDVQFRPATTLTLTFIAHPSIGAPYIHGVRITIATTGQVNAYPISLPFPVPEESDDYPLGANLTGYSYYVGF